MLVEIRLVVRIGEFRDHAGAIVEHDEDDRALRSEDEAAGDLARRGDVEVSRRQPSIVVHDVARQHDSHRRGVERTLSGNAIADLAIGLDRDAHRRVRTVRLRSEEHTSELQSLMRISYAVFCLKKKKEPHKNHEYRI